MRHIRLNNAESAFPAARLQFQLSLLVRFVYFNVFSVYLFFFCCETMLIWLHSTVFKQCNTIKPQLNSHFNFLIVLSFCVWNFQYQIIHYCKFYKCTLFSHMQYKNISSFCFNSCFSCVIDCYSI